MGKWTISEFLKRLTATSWNRHYERVLQVIRGFLVVTFLAVVIGTLAECRPFSHYWQVRIPLSFRNDLLLTTFQGHP